MKATVLIGAFNVPNIFVYLFPDLCLNTILSLGSIRQLLGLYDLVFTLTCTVNFRTCYIDRFVAFQIMFNELNLLKVVV